MLRSQTTERGKSKWIAIGAQRTKSEQAFGEHVRLSRFVVVDGWCCIFVSCSGTRMMQTCIGV